MPHIAFVDESGDHGLTRIDPASPMFALTAAVYWQETYLTSELPAIARMKHRFWSHEGAILRSYDMGKRQGAFNICVDPVIRDEIRAAISTIFANSSMKLISAVIDKDRHRNQYVDPSNVYFLSVQFVLERVFMMTGRDTIVVFESRGKKEDAQLKDWCSRITGGENYSRKELGCHIHFAKKSQNVAGLQIADLACQPIIHFVQNPETQRPDWLAVKPRLRANGQGNFKGRGLKVFP